LLLAILFSLWGVRCLLGALDTEASWHHKLPGLILAALTLATAYGLFSKRSWTLRVYIVWVGSVILAGIVVEAMSDTPGVVILVGMGLMTAVYVAIGFYMRTALKEAG